MSKDMHCRRLPEKLNKTYDISVIIFLFFYRLFNLISIWIS